MSRVRISPAMVIALIALFFAVGGSAFAVTKKVLPQPKCAQGAVRGIAEVTGLSGKGTANIPDSYQSSAGYFGRHFNCSGGAIQVRRTTSGVFYVKFAGNAATSAVASAMGSDPAAATVVRQADGSFLVNVGSHTYPQDEGFTIVAF